MIKKTFYITLEGGDGSGKSTLFESLKTYLESLNLKVLATKEFGSSLDPYCSEIRKIALSSSYNLDELAGQIAFASIIRQHHQKVILPTLKNKTHDLILSDRGIDSNFAYGPAHGLSSSIIKKLFSVAYEGSKLPDLTIYLNIDPKIAQSRVNNRTPEILAKNGVDRIEQKGIKLQEKVRKNFLKLAKKHSRIQVIEITKETTPEEVLNACISLLKKSKMC